MHAVDILNTRSLKRTGCREGIIEVMMQSEEALSENEIRERLSGTFDRTTFYRSFKTLVANKIIHKIVVDNHFVKYALDHSLSHHAEHIHFYCNECQSVQCVEAAPTQAFKLPSGYTAKETEVLIKGTCPDCKDQMTNT